MLFFPFLTITSRAIVSTTNCIVHESLTHEKIKSLHSYYVARQIFDNKPLLQPIRVPRHLTHFSPSTATTRNDILHSVNDQNACDSQRHPAHPLQLLFTFLTILLIVELHAENFVCSYQVTRRQREELSWSG